MINEALNPEIFNPQNAVSNNSKTLPFGIGTGKSKSAYPFSLPSPFKVNSLSHHFFPDINETDSKKMIKFIYQFFVSPAKSV